MKTLSRSLAASAVAALAMGMAPTASAQAATTYTTLKPGMSGTAVKALQTRLNSLGYWVGTADGVYGSQTAQAVMAYQKVAGIGRDGVAGPVTQTYLAKGLRPGATSTYGAVVEIDKARQILKTVVNGKVTRIYNTSTGGNYYYYSGGTRHFAATPSGTFKVWYIYSNNTWQNGTLGYMYAPHYFNRGIAVHGSPFSTVGAYPASHGCARVSVPSQNAIIASGFMKQGSVVKVY